MQKSKCLRVRNSPFFLLHLNSGFNIHNQVKIGSQDERGRESLAQYILRSPFSQEKMTYRLDSKTVKAERCESSASLTFLRANTHRLTSLR